MKKSKNESHAELAERFQFSFLRALRSSARPWHGGFVKEVAAAPGFHGAVDNG